MSKSTDAIQREIDSLEREVWHGDEHTRRAVIQGLTMALRLVEAAEVEESGR